jgi:hypothetical protein
LHHFNLQLEHFSGTIQNKYKRINAHDVDDVVLFEEGKNSGSLENAVLLKLKV